MINSGDLLVPSARSCFYLLFNHPAMDAQYPFATRDDLWRVFDELKELHLGQFEQNERIAKLERDRDDQARLKNVWSSALSPLHSADGGPVPSGICFSSLVRLS